MTAISATLGFYSVIAALVMAIRGREPMRKGVNDYERKKNAQAAAWNRIYVGAFWVAFGTAGAAFVLTVF